MLKVIRSFRHLPKRKQAILVIVGVLILIIVGLLIWAIVTGKIKPFAAGNTQITNTAYVTYDGLIVPIASNTVVVDIIPSSVNLTVNLSLQGKTDSSVSGTTLTVYPVGQETPVFTKSDISTDANGNATFPVTDLVVGTNYDFKIKNPFFLATKKTNIPFTDNLSINFDQQIAGDLDNNNQINMFDYSRLITIWRTRTGDANFNPNFDIAQNGEINIYDYSLLISNWRRQGAL